MSRHRDHIGIVMTVMMAIIITTVLAVGFSTQLISFKGSKAREVNALTGPKQDPLWMEKLPLHRCTTANICNVVGVNFYMKNDKSYYLVRIQKPDDKEVEVIPFDKDRDRQRLLSRESWG
jgi:hypothetical protein